MGRFISSVINIFQSRWVTIINVGEDRGVCMDPYPRVSTLLFPPNFVLPTPAPFFSLFFFRVPPPQIQIFCQSPKPIYLTPAPAHFSKPPPPPPPMCRMKLLIHSQTSIKGCTVEVWEWFSNFNPHFSQCIITYPCWD